MNIVAGAPAGNGPGAGWRIGADEAAANQLVAMCLNAKGGGGRLDGESETLIPTNGGVFDVAATLNAQSGEQTGQEARNGNLIAFEPTPITSAQNRSNPQPGDPCHTLAKGAHAPAIAFNARQDPINGPINGPIDCDGGSNGVMIPQFGVRRLIPEECETLQGFERGYTRIPLRNSKGRLTGKFAKDGPRYRALGNSWAVNCARWIGRRIDLVEGIHVARPEIQ